MQKNVRALWEAGEEKRKLVEVERAHPLCLRRMWGWEDAEPHAQAGLHYWYTSPRLGIMFSGHLYCWTELYLSIRELLRQTSQFTICAGGGICFIWPNPCIYGKKKKSIVSLITILQVSNLIFTSLGLTKVPSYFEWTQTWAPPTSLFPLNFLCPHLQVFFFAIFKVLLIFQVQFKWYPLSLFCFLFLFSVILMSLCYFPSYLNTFKLKGFNQ